jgi:hypothetical protein
MDDHIILQKVAWVAIVKRHVFDIIDCRGTPLNKLKIDFYPNVVAWHNLNMHLKSFLFHSPPIFSFIFVSLQVHF